MDAEQRADDRLRHLRWGALCGLAVTFAIALISIFSASMTINYLGKEDYGIWAIITAFFLWVQFFDFGIMNGLTNALSEAFGRDDYFAAQKYISTAFAATLFLSLIGVVVSLCLCARLPWQNFLAIKNPQQGHLLGKGIAVIGCFFFLNLPFGLSLRILQAYQRMHIAHLWGFVSYLLGLFGVMIGISLHCTFLELLILATALPSLCPIACWFVIAKKFFWARFSWKHVQGFALKRLSSSSVFLLIYQLLNISAFQMIPLKLAAQVTLKSVADFNILWKIFQFLLLMAVTISTSSNPAMRDAFERNENAWIRKMLFQVLSFQALIVLLSCLPLLFAGNFLIETWIRMPLEQPLGKWEWLVFAGSLLLSVFNTTLSSMLNFFDKTGFQILLSFITGMCLFFGIHLGAARWGLSAIFIILLGTSCLCFILSLCQLKRFLVKCRKNNC